MKLNKKTGDTEVGLDLPCFLFYLLFNLHSWNQHCLVIEGSFIYTALFYSIVLDFSFGYYDSSHNLILILFYSPLMPCYFFTLFDFSVRLLASPVQSFDFFEQKLHDPDEDEQNI